MDTDREPEVSVAPAPRRRWAAVVADVGPLRRSREFRLLFVGEGLSFAGSMVTDVAVPYQVYALSHSSLLVGAMSLMLFVPYLGVGLVGGALADAVDRRKLIVWTEVGLAGCSALLVVNAAVGHARLWVVFVVTFLSGALGAAQRPSLVSLLPRVVEPGDIPAANAVHSTFINVGQVAGPALAGVLIATGGVRSAFGVDLASSLVALVALWRMRAAPPAPDADRPSLASIAAGFRYARSRQDLLGTYAVDMAAMFFGIPEALFPQLATHLGGPAVLGLLFTAPAVGSLAVSATSGWVSRVRRHGRGVVLAAAGWGAGIVLLGLADTLWLALLALALAGAADMVSGLMRSIIWNQSVPDGLRGRLAGIEQVSYTSGPLLGNFEGGVAEAVGGLRFSIISGGVACIVSTAAIAVALPRLWRYDSGRDGFPAAAVGPAPGPVAETSG